MPTWLSVILEIIKISVPALVVYLTVRNMLEQHFAHQLRTKGIELGKENQSSTVPLRLQAYERLSLFCERVAIPSLLLRLRQDGMSALELKITLMLAIQQEYEHNITQQVYVSDQLWQIIKISRDETINFITLVADTIDPKADARELGEALMKYLMSREVTALDKALIAIKKEAGIFFG